MNITKTIKTAGVVLRNMILGANIISLSMLTNPRRMFEYVSGNLFLYKTLNNKRGIPQRNVYDVLVPPENEESILLSNLRFGETWMFYASSFLSDIISLCLICRILKPKVVFEIGTMRGYTTYHLALNSPDDAKIYTLDLPKDNNIQSKLETTAMDDFHVQKYSGISEHYWFVNSSVASKISCLFGDSAVFDFSPYFGAVDFFFIDGAHSYQYVRSDTLNALKCCHPGSVIAWHDFGRVGVGGVTRWLNEFSRNYDVYAIPGGSLAFLKVT